MKRRMRFLLALGWAIPVGLIFAWPFLQGEARNLRIVLVVALVALVSGALFAHVWLWLWQKVFGMTISD